MLNEVAYCERLMYLEWVQGEWADNYFTVDGKSVHKRADRGKRVLKAVDNSIRAGDGESLPYSARSVWLSSDRLGMTAKMDVVDVDGCTVVPVEYKRGGKPDVPEGAYLPERVQVCAQVLLLREHGFACDYGEIYFAKERQRTRIEITPELVEQTLVAVARARSVADGGLPQPLVDSPKCHGCSLVGICLPDEVNALKLRGLERQANTVLPVEPDIAHETADPWGFEVGENDEARVKSAVRRLYPARDDKVPLYVQSQAVRIRLDGERLIVQHKDGPSVEARLLNTSHVSVYGNAHITLPAIKALIERGIPLLLFSYGGWYQGRTVGSDAKNVELRLAQYAKSQKPEVQLRLAQGFVASKILNCRTLLRRNNDKASAKTLFELKQLARKARESSCLGSLLGIEGTAARYYFSEFTGMLKQDPSGGFELEGRNRRPPRDPVNAMLSFCYSLLAKELGLAVTAVGMDPMIGFYHQPHFGRQGLALDLMEEFRPVVADSVVVGAINNGVVKQDDFIRAAGAVSLSAPARKRLILAFERRMDQLVTHPVFDYRISYRRVFEVQARLLSRVMLGDIVDYPEFRVR